jgi:type VI secretion system protein ImpL
MWIWFLAAFLVAVVWVAGYFLALGTLTKVLLTLAIVLLVVAVLVVRRLRATAAARALEREIMRQAEQQAMNARPDRRAEIVELQHQIQRGIQSLKTSKLGGATGARALYALPWYLIIGPPGAGKTTALKASGLQFPFLDPRGGGVKGVGGTRNCDWWFTNEAILLDTAGRYATERDDHEEWIAFLDSLRRYRSKKPINGVLVAISVADLATATEEQIDTYAKKLRARIDEVMTRLEMVIPVYVLFTKADLIGGFVEFWGDLRKSERGQIWGATFPLGQPIDDPQRRMDEEFEALIKALHARAVRRVGTERQADARQKIFQFPLEVATLRANLAEFVGALFTKNNYQETPVFRGVYFTSGTQEGRPMDRVLGSMARAFGLRPQVDGPSAQVESKSYFVTDVFRKVVFPDQDVAGRTAREVRRQRLRRYGYALAALAFALLLVIPSSCTYARNQALVGSTREIATNAAKGGGTFGEGDAALARVQKLAPIKDRVRQLDEWRRDGAPIGCRWGMYVGDKLYPPLRDVYVGLLGSGFAAPSKAILEGRLRSTDASVSQKGETFNRTYDDLKAYLMMSDLELAHLDPAWVVPRLVRVWENALRLTPSAETDAELRPHVATYVDLVKRGEIPPWQADRGLVARTRSSLLQVPQVDREYEALVRDANFEIAAIRFDDIFYGASAAFVSSKKTTTVPGAYTRLGWARVRELLEEKQGKLAAERWVLGEAEKVTAEDIRKQIAKLRELYFERYKIAWRDFLGSIEVQKPPSNEKALEELQALTEPEWPYLRLLRTLHENVDLEPVPPPTLGDEAEGALKKKLAEAEKNVKEKLGLDAGVAPKGPSVVARTPVEIAFRPLTRFAVVDGEKADPSKPTGLSQYIATLTKLIGLLTDIRDSSTPKDPKALAQELEQAYRTTSGLLADQDAFTRPLLSPLLMRPIALTWAALSADVGGGQGGIWEVAVWPKWNGQLEKKYPFAPAASEDASLADFAEFFKPKTGTLWGFYEQELKGSLERRGDRFVPTRRFQSAVPYTAAFLACLKRASEVTAGTFGPTNEAEVPVVEFEINLHSVSPDVSEVTFEVDGVGHTYRNEPERWIKVRWPAKDAQARGGKLGVRGYSGLEEEITRPGDFGFFRLLDAAKIKPGTSASPGTPTPTLVATWDLRTQKGAFVRMELRPARNEAPFRDGFFKNVNCPRTIVSAE